MLYSSRNGTLFYYDRVLYTWQVAEPTMLFLLGLEAVTSFDNALSDSLVIANCVYIKDQNDVVPFENFKIYDKIHSYLSQLSSIEDLEYYLKFNCNGLKLLLNELTGTGTDRTVPLIFRNDVNNKSIDLNSTMARLTSSDSATLYDRQAQKIRDIFSDASYSGGETINLNDIEDKFLKEYMRAKNMALTEYYAERRDNGQIYKLLDYRAMYSYALGVLYGCRCLGFKPLLIWRIDPKFWYNGEFENLVSTAWYVFRFHHSSYIPELDDSIDTSLSDRYKGITPNRLWNFGSEPNIDLTVPLHASEMNCYALHVDRTNGIPPWNSETSEEVLLAEKSVAEPIIYSQYEKKSISISHINYFYSLYDDPNYCYIITAFGDSLPIDSLYEFKFIITDPSNAAAEPIVKIKMSSSRNVLILSSSDDADDSAICSYLNSYRSYDPNVDISIIVTIGDKYTSDELHLDDWEDVKPQGQYLYISEDEESIAWCDVESKIQDTDPKTGIVAASSTPIVRYLADDPIVIHKAYKWLDSYRYSYITADEAVERLITIRQPEYLSPNENEIYFIATGNLGWSYFNENLYKDSTGRYPYKLSAVPYSDLPEDDEHRLDVLPNEVDAVGSYIPIRYARYKVDNSIVTYYKCYVSDSNSKVDGPDIDDTFIYGIFNGNVIITENMVDDELSSFSYDYTKLINYKSSASAVGFFKEFISEDLFKSLYTEVSLVAGCTLNTWYDIDIPVSIFIKDGSGNTLMYTGLGDQEDPTDENNYTLISNYGYTEHKSIAVSAYCYASDYRDESTNLVIPKPYNLRYYSVTDKYWSNEDDPIWLIDEQGNRGWKDAYELGDNIYRVTGDSRVYRGQTLIYYSTRTYSLISNNNDSYIFSDSSAKYSLDPERSVQEGFQIIKPSDNDQSIESWWKHGYTTHVCSFVLKDDNGHYLTDDKTSTGTPLVWYDQDTDMYWNGLADIMRWQKIKPLLNSQLVYNTYPMPGTFSQAIDDPENEIISIDGDDYISYNDFYSDDHNGVVRYKLKVFNSTKTEGIIDCLVDDKNDPDHPENAIYCIPGVTPTWVSRGEILPDYGYRFVDGMTALYTGADRVDVVIDDDDTD